MAQQSGIIDYQLTSFSSGELSPRLQGRIDSKSYMQGCEALRNNIILPQGGATRRPGTIYAAGLKYIDHRMYGFKGTDGLSYEFVLEENQLFVYDSDGTLVSTLASSIPWDSTHLDEIKFVLSGNTLLIFHNLFRTQVITYTPVGTTFARSDWTPSDVTAFSAWIGGSPITAGNYPGCGTLYEGRLLISGSINNPDLYHGTVAGTLDKFTTPGTPITDADAYEKRAALPGSLGILWLIGMGPLFIGTNVGVATKSSRDEIMTSLTSSFTLLASSYGASSQQGFLMGGEVFYIQYGGKKIRLAQYNSDTETYLSPDILAHAEHISRVGIKRAAFMESPESLLWIVLNDGTFASMTYEPAVGMTAWTTHETDGDVVDLCISWNGEDQRVWVLVDRDDTIQLEYIDELLPSDQNDNYFVDGGSKVVVGEDLDISSVSAIAVSVAGETYYSPHIILEAGSTVADGEYVRVRDTGNLEIDYKMYLVGDWDIPTNSFNLYDVETEEHSYVDSFDTILSTGYCHKVSDSLTGLTHLANLEVDCSIDGGDAGTLTVSAAGVAALPWKGNKISIGRPMTSYITPMNIASAKNERKRIIGIMAEVYKSIGGKAGKDLNTLDPFPTQEVVVMDNPPELNTGAMKVPVRGGSSFNGDIIIVQDRPLPLTVLSIIAEIEIGE